MPRIIFVCTGNICRSPMAEGLMRHQLEAAGLPGWIVSSMGTHGLDGEPAQPFARQVCRDHGIDIEAHTGRSLIGEEIREADLILCMEPVHCRILRTFFPWQKAVVHLLGAWPGGQSRHSAVPDPMGAPLTVYRRVFEQIDAHVRRILPNLAVRCAKETKHP